jgi:hypothetical protein
MLPEAKEQKGIIAERISSSKDDGNGISERKGLLQTGKPFFRLPLSDCSECV